MAEKTTLKELRSRLERRHYGSAVVLVRTCIIVANLSACSSGNPVVCRILCKDALDSTTQVASVVERGENSLMHSVRCAL